MNKDEFVAMRVKTELPVTWLAKYVGHHSARAWWTWETGQHPVPEAVADRLAALAIVLDKFLVRSKA